MKLKLLLRLIPIVVVLIILGGFREIMFLNTNAQIAQLEGHIANSGVLDWLSFLRDMDVSELYSLKWVMTVGFSVLFWAISATGMWLIFKNKAAIKWLTILYLAIFCIAGIFLIIGRMAEWDVGYTISRECMGGLQSPFPALVLIPSYLLLNSEVQKA